MSGQGSRFVAAGIQIPKFMLKLGKKTILERIVANFPGVTDCLFILNEEHYNSKYLNLGAYFKDNFPKAKVCAIAPHKNGPGYAIQQASEFVESGMPVVANYCDFDWRWNFSNFSRHLMSDIDGLIATYSGFHPHMIRNSNYAYVKVDSNAKVIDIREKESFTNNPFSEEASSGTYGFRSGEVLLNAIQKQINDKVFLAGESYLSLTYKPMLDSGMHIETFNIDKFVQLGTPEDYLEFEKTRRHFALEKSTGNNLKIDNYSILAAGLGSRFSDKGYKTPKPFLPIMDKNIISHSVEVTQVPTEKVSVILSDETSIPEYFSKWVENNSIKLIRIENRTGGQAATAKIALENASGPTLVAPCDSIIIPPDLDNEMQSEFIMSVFLSKPNFSAISNADQFGWVELDESNLITNYAIKTPPKNYANWYVITGYFYFQDPSLVSILLDDFLKSGVTVNGEYYLDSFIGYLMQQNYSVNGVVLDSFMSLGTPDEYESYIYWFEFFTENSDYLDEE